MPNWNQFPGIHKYPISLKLISWNYSWMLFISLLNLFHYSFAYSHISWYKMVWVWWIGRHDIGNLPLKLPAKPRPGPQTRRRQPVLNVETLIMLQLQGAFPYNVIGRLIQILRERKFKINQMLSYNIHSPVGPRTYIFVQPQGSIFLFILIFL